MVRGSVSERAWQWNSPAEVHLASYETLRQDFTDNPQSPPRRRTWEVVVLDEAQRIKNRDSETSRKCKQLHRRRAWALTGTPLENRADDLASIMEFVAPLAPGEVPRSWLPGPHLALSQRGLQLRRRKDEVLPQLPPKLSSTITLSLSGRQKESYERAEHEGVRRLKQEGPSVRNVLALITRLKQICNFCPESGRSVKLEDLRERLVTLEAEGHRALVFSQFADARFGARAIAAGLHPFRPLIHEGELAIAEREQALRAFRTEPDRQVLVLTLGSGARGLDLQGASYVFHFDRWWNPATERQAEARAHRLGQASPVNVYRYLLENTIEARIDRLLRGKQALFEAWIEGVTLDLAAVLSPAELFGLFDLVPPGPSRRLPADDPTASRLATVARHAFVPATARKASFQLAEEGEGLAIALSPLEDLPSGVETLELRAGRERRVLIAANLRARPSWLPIPPCSTDYTWSAPGCEVALATDLEALRLEGLGASVPTVFRIDMQGMGSLQMGDLLRPGAFRILLPPLLAGSADPAESWPLQDGWRVWELEIPREPARDLERRLQAMGLRLAPPSPALTWVGPPPREYRMGAQGDRIACFRPGDRPVLALEGLPAEPVAACLGPDGLERFLIPAGERRLLGLEGLRSGRYVLEVAGETLVFEVLETAGRLRAARARLEWGGESCELAGDFAWQGDLGTLAGLALHLPELWPVRVSWVGLTPCDFGTFHALPSLDLEPVLARCRTWSLKERQAELRLDLGDLGKVTLRHCRKVDPGALKAAIAHLALEREAAREAARADFTLLRRLWLEPLGALLGYRLAEPALAAPEDCAAWRLEGLRGDELSLATVAALVLAPRGAEPDALRAYALELCETLGLRRVFWTDGEGWAVVSRHGLMRGPMALKGPSEEFLMTFLAEEQP